MIDVLGTSLLRGLMCEDIPFHDVMNAFNIKTTIAFNISSRIHGFVYVSQKGNYHIILNGNISYEVQCSTFLHEVTHIVKDLPRMNYIIGLDMHHEMFEIEANNVLML